MNFLIIAHLSSCHTDIEGAGRGAIAREDLEVGDIALEIPVSIIISEDLVHKTSMVSLIHSSM